MHTLWALPIRAMLVPHLSNSTRSGEPYTQYQELAVTGQQISQVEEILACRDKQNDSFVWSQWKGWKWWGKHWVKKNRLFLTKSSAGQQTDLEHHSILNFTSSQRRELIKGTKHVACVIFDPPLLLACGKIRVEWGRRDTGLLRLWKSPTSSCPQPGADYWYLY